MKKENIQNYVLENKEEIPKAGTTYEIAVETKQDFVIRRKTTRTSKIFAMIVSELTFYIKDENTNKVDPVTPQGLNSFFRDLKEEIHFESVTWIHRLYHDNLNFLISIIQNEEYCDLCKKNLYYSRWELQQCLDFSKSNKAILEQIIERTPKNFNFGYCAALFMKSIFSKYGKQHSDYFLESYLNAPIESINIGYTHSNYWISQHEITIHNLFELLISRNIDINNFIDFLFYGTYQQGFFHLEHNFFNEYIGYLSNQNTYYNEIPDPFPKNLHQMSRILSKKIKVIQSEHYEELFTTILREQKEYACCGKNHSLKEIGVDAFADRCFEVGINIDTCFQNIKNGAIPMELQTSNNYYIVFIKDNIISKIYSRNGAIIEKETMDWLEEWSSQKGMALEYEVAA